MQKLKRLEKIYSKLPKIKCKKLCHEGCGPINASPIELKRIVNLIGHNPFKDNNDLLRKIASGQSIGYIKSCPLLNDKKECSVYEARPLICRVFGVVKRLKCPHGCIPERWLSDLDAVEIFKEIEKL